MRYTFPSAKLKSYKATRSHVAFLASLNPVAYDCCINSCIWYVGPYEDQQSCHYCKEVRYGPNHKARKRFIYIPLIPRLVAYFKNHTVIHHMEYHSGYTHDLNIIKDVFDSNHYRSLLDKNVTADGKYKPDKFFADPRDIALGLSTDGFAPFRRRKSTAWPLILFNYNLPPEIRFHLCHILCVGVILGPKKPKDFDSFLWPLVVELLRLQNGVRAFDVITMELFALHAHLILCFGDMPAVSMVMWMKGHNGLLPCCMCKIKALCIPDSWNPAHYVPLDRSSHPHVRNKPGEIQKYNVFALHLQSHDEFLDQARQVQFASTNAESDHLATTYGMKGVPLLSCLSSLSFPISFPLDFMHLMYENVIKNLVLLWTGKYKDLDEGSESYELNASVWDAIGKATADSGATIPSAFAARPQNVADNKAACTADSWSFWALYLGPVLLRGKFLKNTYYNHFIKLVKLIQICLQFEIEREDIAKLRVGFQEWVEEYEK
jgi:Transposase family tnp2